MSSTRHRHLRLALVFMSFLSPAAPPTPSMPPAFPLPQSMKPQSTSFAPPWQAAPFSESHPPYCQCPPQPGCYRPYPAPGAYSRRAPSSRARSRSPYPPASRPPLSTPQFSTTRRPCTQRTRSWSASRLRRSRTSPDGTPRWSSSILETAPTPWRCEILHRGRLCPTR